MAGQTCSLGLTIGFVPTGEQANRHMRDDVVDQVRRSLRHAPRAAQGTKPPALAAKGNELVVATVAAAQAQEVVRQDAALKKRVELVLDELRQAGAGGLLGLGEEGLGGLLVQPVQRGLLGPMALVVDRGPIRRPMARTGLPTDGLLTRYCFFLQNQTSQRAATALCGA